MSAKSNRTANLTMPSDREVVITREFDVPRELLYEAWTGSEHLPKWLTGLPGWRLDVHESDLRPGGAWRLVWRNDEGAELAMHGEYREVVPLERIVNTESWGGPWPETLNTVSFAEKNGVTTLTLRILYPSKEARDAALQTGMTDGMNATFANFDEYLRALE